MLQRVDDTFLLARRPADKIWAGYWEFPGGKIEPGETPYHALVRELREELGIEVETAYPWVTRVFTYPHATVRLNFFRVTKWSGDLHPHEGQEFAWQSPTPTLMELLAIRLSPQAGKSLVIPRREREIVSPMLPANAPILRALELPALYAISNVGELGVEEFLRRMESALQKGLRLVQLREKHLSRDELRNLALKILPLMKQSGACLLINSDIELAQEVGADGVQLAATQLVELKTRPDLSLCAASCHNQKELRLAEELGCDFALLGPVLPTQSHPGTQHLGWKIFSEIINGCSIPVYGLGGLCRDDMETAWRHGAHGIALLRQAW